MSREAYESRCRQSAQDGRREFITLLACVSVLGKTIPPTLLYKGQSGDLQSTWVEDLVIYFSVRPRMTSHRSLEVYASKHFLNQKGRLGGRVAFLMGCVYILTNSDAVRTIPIQRVQKYLETWHPNQKKFGTQYFPHPKPRITPNFSFLLFNKAVWFLKLDFVFVIVHVCLFFRSIDFAYSSIECEHEHPRTRKPLVFLQINVLKCCVICS